MNSEKALKWFLTVIAVFTVVLGLAILFTLIYQSRESLIKLGLSFFYKKDWNPVTGEFGSLVFLVGTLLTSVTAILISIPFSLGIALFLGEYYPRGFWSNLFKSLIELLAGIPSVIYGMWGLFVFVPVIRNMQLYLLNHGIINVPPYGVGIFTSSVILAVMIIPYSASIAREVISMVPKDLKEAAYSLGSTRFEVIRHIILPFCKSGISAGTLLAFGRALGETMAVTMVIGNSNYLPKSLFDPGNTLASAIANEFTEAVDPLYMSSLIELGLVLFMVTAVINVISKKIIQRSSI